MLGDKACKCNSNNTWVMAIEVILEWLVLFLDRRHCLIKLFHHSAYWWVGRGGEDVIGLVYVDLFSFWYTVPAELGVVPRLIIQLRVVQVFVSGCFHARYTLTWTLTFCISLFLLRRSLKVDSGIRNRFLSCVQGTVWLDCLLSSTWWGLACDREESTEHLAFPFSTLLV